MRIWAKLPKNESMDGKEEMEFSFGTNSKHRFSVEESWWVEAKMPDFMPKAKHYTPPVRRESKSLASHISNRGYGLEVLTRRAF